jgi:zinc/manganese transport system permease protein
LLRDGFFYPAFAIVASMVVPVLGLFVVFAALIAPALWQRTGCGRMVSWLGAFAACAAGLAASWVLDTPSGPAVALALSTFGALSALRRPARPVA